MNIVVSNGSYKNEYKNSISRFVVIDEEKNIYCFRYNGLYLFPGLVNDDKYKGDYNSYLIDTFGDYESIEYYGNFRYYYLNRFYSSTGKRLSTNSLDTTTLYIVRIDSRSINESYDGIEKVKYQKIFDCVNSSKDERYREEMLVLLKMLPEDVKGRDSIVLKKLKLEKKGL